MKERPIIFNPESVRAILDGRKTQTRRVLKPQPIKRGGIWEFPWGAGSSLEELPVVPCHTTAHACPYGVEGDRLWVRETHRIGLDSDGFVVAYAAGGHRKMFFADLPFWAKEPYWDSARVRRRRPSIHMPRWASRITLGVTAVRVERLQKITEEDAKAEGLKRMYFDDLEQTFSHRSGFEFAWDAVNGQRGYGWDVNPWVWVIEFEVAEISTPATMIWKS